jgi:uncharacterized protein YbjT (DUF2867 family)
MNMTATRLVTLFGSTGKTGRATARALLAAGFSLRAFARRPEALPAEIAGFTVAGDAMNAGDVAAAVKGAAAVVVSLGNSQNPFAMLIGAKRTTHAHICEIGTRNVIEAMRVEGVRRLIVVSSFGVGDTRELATRMTKVFFRLFLKEHMADKEEQEKLVKASGLDWTLIQPVALTDSPAKGQFLVSDRGQVRGGEISRADVAALIVSELGDQLHLSRTVTISG